MDRFQDAIDSELEEAGFGKAAAVRVVPATKPTAAPDVQGLPKTAQDYDLSRKLRKQLRESALRKLGSTSPEAQVFSSSDILNRIKIAGILDSIARGIGDYAPAETTLKLVSGLKNLAGGYAPASLGTLEAMLAGRAIREAGQFRDVPLARRIYESFGGTPTIDPSELAGLQAKAMYYDQLSKNPMSQSLPAALLGGLAGMGAGAGLAHHYGKAAPQAAQPQQGPMFPQVIYRGGHLG